MPKILLVDDSVELCNELAEVFREEGYLIDNTSNSTDGVMLIQTKSYDLCIFDYKMNGLSGIDLLKITKNLHPQCPVLIMSGKPSIMELIKKEKVANLIVGVIHKPFNIGKLLQKVKSIL